MDGRLREQFTGVGAKRISATEAAKTRVSRGHELSASPAVAEMLGGARAELPCTYLYFSKAYEETGYIEDISTVSLYDSRERQPSRTSEWRLYYPFGCAPMESMEPGDYCWVARKSTGSVIIAVAEMGTSVARKLDRLFGTNLRLVADATQAQPFQLFDLANAGDDDLDIADVDLLLALGVAPTVENTDRLPGMIDTFGGRYPLPTTSAFTAYARGVCAITTPETDPDAALYTWVSVTNDLYFTYERHVLQPILDAELANREHVDVEAFFRLATRFKNARFSRAGTSFEHHISALFTAAGLRFAQPRRMSDGSKPDFLLPTLNAWADPGMPEDLLTFLAAKTTTKERWRQIATEASRVPVKHLITLDRELNGDVLDAMDQNHVVPILPRHIQDGYPAELSGRMSTVGEFLEFSRERESEAVAQGLIPPIST